MEIVEHKEIGDGAWDAFCDASPEAWARHRSMTRKGTLVYDKRSEDHSFGVMHDGALVAVAPLITQPLLDSGGGLEFAFSINTRPSDTHGLAAPGSCAHQNVCRPAYRCRARQHARGKPAYRIRLRRHEHYHIPHRLALRRKSTPLAHV